MLICVGENSGNCFPLNPYLQLQQAICEQQAERALKAENDLDIILWVIGGCLVFATFMLILCCCMCCKVVNSSI